MASHPRDRSRGDLLPPAVHPVGGAVISDDEMNPNAGTLVRDRLWFDDGFTMVPNAWLRDDQLSWSARGIAAFLCSHDPGFQLSIDYLVRHSSQGREAVTSALAELERVGYLKRYRGREKGRFGRIKWHLRDPHMPENLHGAVQLDLEELDPLRTKKSRSTPQTGLPYAVAPYAVKPLPVSVGTEEEHLKNTHTQLNEANHSTRAGIEKDASGDSLQVASETPEDRRQRLVHQACPFRKSGGEHDFTPDGGCSYCGIRPTQRWFAGEIRELDDLFGRTA